MPPSKCHFLPTSMGALGGKEGNKCALPLWLPTSASPSDLSSLPALVVVQTCGNVVCKFPPGSVASDCPLWSTLTFLSRSVIIPSTQHDDYMVHSSLMYLPTFFRFSIANFSPVLPWESTLLSLLSLVFLSQSQHVFFPVPPFWWPLLHLFFHWNFHCRFLSNSPAEVQLLHLFFVCCF